MIWQLQAKPEAPQLPGDSWQVAKMLDARAMGMLKPLQEVFQAAESIRRDIAHPLPNHKLVGPASRAHALRTATILTYESALACQQAELDHVLRILELLSTRGIGENLAAD